VFVNLSESTRQVVPLFFARCKFAARCRTLLGPSPRYACGVALLQDYLFAPLARWWNSAWGVLLVAGLLETAWALLLPRTQGWTKLVPSVCTIVLMVLSFVLLARAMKVLPAGLAYAVWTGIGTLGVALVSATFLREPWTLLRVLCLLLIVAGVAGLKWSTKAHT
jgi:quaternary ammonium compound-resistance protein SugE